MEMAMMAAHSSLLSRPVSRLSLDSTLRNSTFLYASISRTTAVHLKLLLLGTYMPLDRTRERSIHADTTDAEYTV